MSEFFKSFRVSKNIKRISSEELLSNEENISWVTHTNQMVENQIDLYGEVFLYHLRRNFVEN